MSSQTSPSSMGSLTTKSTTADSASEASMSCSTYTVRSTSFGGKPSSLPLAMLRMSVDYNKHKSVERMVEKTGSG